MKLSTTTATFKAIRNDIYPNGRINKTENGLGIGIVKEKYNNRYMSYNNDYRVVHWAITSANVTARTEGMVDYVISNYFTVKEYISLMAYCFDNGLTDQDSVAKYLNSQVAYFQARYEARK